MVVREVALIHIFKFSTTASREPFLLQDENNLLTQVSIIILVVCQAGSVFTNFILVETRTLKTIIT